MSNKNHQQLCEETLTALKAYGYPETSLSKAAKEAGIPKRTALDRVKWLQNASPADPYKIPIDRVELPDTDLPIEELVEFRKRQFSQYKAAKEARHLVPIKVRLDGPIAIAHFGDPHVDDDGTDIGLLERHATIIKQTEGMFGANIGDTTNNWVGRLARLYGEQSTSAKQAWALGEWFVKQLDWVYFLDGNHGGWSGAGDPMKWILRSNSGMHGGMGARINLQFPTGKQVRVNAQHNFKGHSQWNTAHGPAKAVQMGWRDHILTCGHLHTSGYQVLKDPSTGLISHAIRVAAYKTFDRYAEELGLPDQNIFCNAVTIINPRFEDNDPRLVHTCFDVEQGADYLTWLRKKEGF